MEKKEFKIQLEALVEQKKSIQSKYDEAIGNPDLLEVTDQMADFLDESIRQNQ